MKSRTLLAVYSLLFLCASMYVGTGGSLVLFSFPVASQLTVNNYYLQFVPQVDAATRFFTWMTTVMIAAALIMLIAEWRTRLRWVPIIVLLGVAGATVLTVKLIFPLNQEMARGITDPLRLQSVLTQWMNLNKWRVVLWLMQWLAMMWYFAAGWSQAYRNNAAQARSAGSLS